MRCSCFHTSPLSAGCEQPTNSISSCSAVCMLSSMHSFLPACLPGYLGPCCCLSVRLAPAVCHSSDTPGLCLLACIPACAPAFTNWAHPMPHQHAATAVITNGLHPYLHQLAPTAAPTNWPHPCLHQLLPSPIGRDPAFTMQIVECSFDVERRVWIYMRERPDKLTANHRSVFDKVMTSISDNITVSEGSNRNGT